MTHPHQVIQAISSAIVNDDLVAAEKALEDYVVGFEMWRIKKIWNDFIMLRDINNQDDPKELYKQFVNQSKQ